MGKKETPGYYTPKLLPLQIVREVREKKKGFAGLRGEKILQTYRFATLDVLCLAIMGDLQFERFVVKQQKSLGSKAIVFLSTKMKKGNEMKKLIRTREQWAFFLFLFSYSTSSSISPKSSKKDRSS